MGPFSPDPVFNSRPGKIYPRTPPVVQNHIPGTEFDPPKISKKLKICLPHPWPLAIIIDKPGGQVHFYRQFKVSCEGWGLC